MTATTATKFLIQISNGARVRYFRNVRNGMAYYVRHSEFAKAFKTEEEAQKYADILFGLTLASYKVVEVAK